jgi:hypothetical protein
VKNGEGKEDDEEVNPVDLVSLFTGSKQSGKAVAYSIKGNRMS